MEIMTADAYNTMTLRRLLRQNGAMSRQDRAFVTEVVNGTLRNLIYIDHVLNTFSKTKTEKMKPWLLAGRCIRCTSWTCRMQRRVMRR